MDSSLLRLQFTDLPLSDRLPSFEGDHRQWIAFKDSFTAEVINNPHLSNVQRLRRLQSCVQGSAAQTLGSWPQREESFADAWATLCEAFDNEYLSVRAHSSAILQLPSLQRGGYQSIREMIDITRNSLRMLDRQLSPPDQRDLLVLDVLESKLDTGSHNAWEMNRPTNRIPSLQQDFLSWLKRRASSFLGRSASTSASESNQQAAGSNQRANPAGARNPASSARSSATGTRQRPRESRPPVDCRNCRGEHPLFRCPLLMRMSRDERKGRLDELRLCHNCLRPGHAAAECRERTCPRCACALHNSLLCPRAYSVNTIIDENVGREEREPAPPGESTESAGPSPSAGAAGAPAGETAGALARPR